NLEENVLMELESLNYVPGHNDGDESNSIDREEESYMNEIIRELLKHVNESG
ncbi:15542_t:CDS:2, partial [Rhizophagus irregularis]